MAGASPDIAFGQLPAAEQAALLEVLRGRQPVMENRRTASANTAYPAPAGLLRGFLTASEPGEVRGNIAPVKQVPGGGWFGTDYSPAIPEMVRHAGVGLLDLLSASSTGQITPEAGEFMTNLTPAGGLSAAVRPSAAGSLGIFGGRLAKTADQGALARAEQMAAQGADRRAIWDETGFFQGTDGKWRFEIDDSQSDFRGIPDTKYGGYGIQELNGSLEYPSSVVGFRPILKHDDLTGAYPNTKEIDLSQQNGKLLGDQATRGSYSPSSTTGIPERISLYGNADDPKSTLLHELQHAVQEREGFGQGGNPAEFGKQEHAKLARDALSWRKEIARMRQQMPKADSSAVENAIIDEYRRMDMIDWLPSREARDLALDRITNPDEQLSQLVSLYGLDRKTTPEPAETLYKRQTGEVEARNVQKRRDYSPDQRRATPPWETQDVPDEQQIVRFGAGGPSLMAALEKGAGHRRPPPATDALPMDEASRMARALEMGFDTDAYHVTGADFDEFKAAPYRGASYFGATPDGAVRGAAAGAADGTGSRGPLRTLPVKLKSDEIYGLALTPKEKDFWKSLPERVNGDAMDIALLKDKSPNMGSWYRFYEEVHKPDGSFEYVKRPVPKITLEEAQRTGLDVYGRQFPHWNPGTEKPFGEKVAREGMSGYVQIDEAGTTVGVTDPTKVRSRFAAFDPAKRDSANLLAAKAPTGVGMPALLEAALGKYGKGPIKAYHGSPHDFDKFSLDRIGTGEGAQAYGHGLYFAENEGVARGYRDNLSKPTNVRVAPDSYKPEDIAVAFFRSLGKRNGAWQARRLAKAEPEHSEAYLKAADIIENGDPYASVSPGRMYEVAIHADPERFLDWDKPLKEQPTGETVKRLLTDRMIQPHDAMRGVNAYGELGTHYDQIFARKPGLNADEDVTKVLRRAGIPGIKYLDAGSRSSGDGSRNYVVFDDDVIEILRKYGIVPSGVGAPALAGSANQDTSDRRGLLDALNTLN
jgi:hypothetical protein